MIAFGSDGTAGPPTATSAGTSLTVDQDAEALMWHTWPAMIATPVREQVRGGRRMVAVSGCS